jgi:hypothetical protein
MNAFLRRLRLWLFPPVSRRQAVDIARTQSTPAQSSFRVYGRKPGNVNIYNLPAEACWFVFASWGDGKDGTILRSSRVLLVSKLSGKVLYDGTANDEG